MRAAPELSIVIVTWNVRDDVLRCLDALAADPALPAHEIVLVDNASADGTPAAVGSAHPGVRVLVTARNEGFPHANNQGVAVARGEHVLFLNPDTEVGRGTVASCVEVLRTEPGVGVVGCRLVLPDGRTQFECARRHYRLGDAAREVLGLHTLFPDHPACGRHLMGDWDHRDRRDVEAVSGAFLMIRRTVLEEVGGMPESLFMYFEDAALCLRVRRAGHRVRFLGDVTTLHHHGRSSRQAPGWIAVLEAEAKRMLVAEAQGPLAGAAARVLLGARAGVRLALSVALAPVPRNAALRRRHPRLFRSRDHAAQFLWALWPPYGRARISRAGT